MYRNMKNKILGGLMLVLVLCFTACEDEQLFGRDGNTTIRISATAKFSGAESRAVLATEYKATENNVFMLYKGTDKNATLEVMEAMTSLEGTIKNVLIEGGATYTAIMIANVPKSELESQGVVVGSKLEALYSATYAVNTTYNKPTDAAAFTWSGVVCGITTANVRNGLNFELNPNVAKVKFTIENTSEDNESTEVVGVQVRNVLNKVRYAQNALNEAGLFATSQNKEGGPSYIDYDKEEIRVASNGGKETFYWYVPCNMLGEGSRKPTVNIPSGSTFLEVTGVRNVDYLSTIYKIYLGVKNGSEAYADMTNFDVRPNYVYDVNVTITNDGLDFDVTNNYNTATNTNTSIGLVKLPSNANCYMINPNFSKTANGYPVYELPIDRINECWLDPAINDASMSLGTNDEWVMDVIWQDIDNRVIKFCDKNGGSTSDTYSGKGLVPAYFKIADGVTFPMEVDINTNSYYGNILVGVKKKNTSDYLWSWHLWVTNYNPDVATPYSIAKNMKLKILFEETANSLYHENKGSFNKINGSVQHWYHTQSYYWGSNFGSKAIWEGLYEDCWIMDRNLGAVSYEGNSGSNMSYGCYYQWGNKNPYPHATYKVNDTYEIHNINKLKKLYKIGGKPADDAATTFFTVDTRNTSTQKTIQEVTKNPTICYYNSTSQLYNNQYSGRNNYWASLKSNPNNGYSQKSIFDPCPPGWCVPMYNIFDMLTYNPASSDFDSNTTMYYSGAYNSLFPTFNVWRKSETSNSMADHSKATFFRKNRQNDSSINTLLTAVFPTQGAICDYLGNGYIAISGNTRSMLWFAESSVISSQSGKGEAVEMFSDDGSSYIGLNSNATTRTQTVSKITAGYVSNTPYKYITNGRASHIPHVKSYGFNIRCIQVPGGEQLKYYNN